jgi:iron complex outermembrane recepter protein
MRKESLVDRIDCRNQRSQLLTAAVAVALGAVLQPGEVRAQGGGEAQLRALDEIVVTARKRDEGVQTVPMSISVFGGENLVDQRLFNTSELQFAVPGFYVQNFETRATITMRGVGAQIAGGTSAVATHVNGVYQASSAAQLNRLFDIDRVEVVKGPQGTLYGRNSTGGALNIITRRPGPEFGADVSVAYGTYDTVRVDGGLSLPLGPDWGLRVAGSYAEGDGQFRNDFNDSKVGEESFLGGRLSLSGNAGPVDVDFFVQSVRDDDTTATTLIPLVSSADATPLLGWDRTYMDNPVKPFIERELLIAGLTLSGEIGGGYSWRSITGYLDYEDDSLLDVNPRPAPVQLFIEFPQFAEQFSQEFQLLYQADRFNWVLGAYYLDDKQRNSRYLELAPIDLVLINNEGRDRVKASALFGDLNYNLTDQWRLNVGLRWNHEDVRNSFAGTGLIDGGPFDLSGSQNDLTGRIGADYTARPGLMFYGSLSTGYQAGFFDTSFDSVTGEDVPSRVDPENILAYEIGMKSVLPGERGYLNVAAFYYDYKDMQVRKGGLFVLEDGSPDPNQPPFFFTANAAKAEIYGVDLELTRLRLAQHLRADFMAQYLHAEYKEYDTVDNSLNPVSYAGNRLPRAPEWELTSAVTLDNLRLGGAATGEIRLEYNYRGKTYFTEDNSEVATQAGFGLFNLFASVEFEDGRWRLFGSGRNLANKKFFDFHRGDVIANTGEFRTWEIGVRYNFR